MRQYTESSPTQTVAAAPAANGAAPAPTFTVGLKTEAVAAPGPTAGNVERAREIVDRSTHHYSTEMMADDWDRGRDEIDRDTVIREIAAALSAERVSARAELLAQIRDDVTALLDGKIEMFSLQRPKPGQPPRWCALARGSKTAAYGDTPAEAVQRALADKLTEAK